MRQKGIILSAQGVAALSGVCDLYTSSTTISLPDLDGLNIHPPCCMGRCAPFQLEFELLYSFKPFKPQPSVLWLSLAWHITSLRHCAGIQKETPGKLRYCLLPRLLILCGSFCLPFFLCIPDAPSDPPAQVSKLLKASCGTVGQMERANI